MLGATENANKMMEIIAEVKQMASQIEFIPELYVENW